MSIDINDNIEEKVIALEARLSNLESFQETFILTQDAQPTQKDWEDAWVAAGETLPIPPEQELLWSDGYQIRGEFSTLNDSFFSLFSYPHVNTSISQDVEIRGVNSDNTLFYGIFPSRTSPGSNAAGRIYLDGYREIGDADIGWGTFTELLHYDRHMDYLWVRDGSNIEIRDANNSWAVTNVLTLSGSHTFLRIWVEPNGDAYFSVTETGTGSGAIWFWDESAGSASLFKAQITINGVNTTIVPNTMPVICSTATHVVVATAINNYWIAIRKSDLAQHAIKSIVSGATAANLPAITNGVAWRHTLHRADHDANQIHFFYTNITQSGRVPDTDWRKTFVWDLASVSYSTLNGLPYKDLLERTIDFLGKNRYLAESFFFYRPTYLVSPSTYEYSGSKNIIRQSRYPILIMNDTNDFVLHWSTGVPTDVSRMSPNILYYRGEDSTRSSGKVWRVSEWDMPYDDVIVLNEFTVQGLGSASAPVSYTFDLDAPPAGYDILEILMQPQQVVGASGSVTVNLGTASANTQGGRVELDAAANRAMTGNTGAEFILRGSDNAANLGGQSRIIIFKDMLSVNAQITGIVEDAYDDVNGTYRLGTRWFGSVAVNWGEQITITVGRTILGQYLTVRAWRSEGRMAFDGGVYGSSLE